MALAWLLYSLLVLGMVSGDAVSPTDDFRAKILNATANELFTLSDGTYYIASTILIPNSIIIQGVGPTNTIIECTGAFHVGFKAINHNMEFRQVTVQNCAPGVAMTNGTLLISDTIWTNNGNAAISVETSPLVVITRSIISNNSAVAYGGGLYMSNVQNFTSTDSVYANNTARVSCGGIFFSSTNFMMANCTLDDNKTIRDNAGGFCTVQSSNGTFKDGKIQNNVAFLHGGGVSIQGGNVTIVNTAIETNQAHYGGAIFLLHPYSSISVLNSSCFKNTAQLAGGCIYTDVNTVTTINNSRMRDNYAESSGGGIYANGYFFMYDSQVLDNNVEDLFFGKGGGIYTDAQTQALEIDLCLVSGNVAVFGGGIYLDNLKVGLLRNNTITENLNTSYINSDIFILPAQTSTMQMLFNTALKIDSIAPISMCCGNTSRLVQFTDDDDDPPLYLVCSYPVCENCINGCNCPLPLHTLSDAGTAYASVNTTCSYEKCDAIMGQDCSVDAFCTKFPDRLSHNCTCNPGYRGNGSVCEDIDECQTNPCDTHAYCTNTNGSFDCTCRGGYSGNGFNCSDVNECTEETKPCPAYADCANFDGYFTCTCQKGLFLSGTSCDDINECSTGTNGCSPIATCFNYFGGYNCTCPSGFQGNGTYCEDIDECAAPTFPCPQNAKCINTPGNFLCDCSHGFSESGAKCEEIVYARGLSIGLGIIVGVAILVGIFAAILLVMHWDLFTRVYGSFYCAIVIAGVIIAEISALTQLPQPTESKICVAFPWLLGIGFTLVYGCLFIKTWMLFRIWQSAMQLKRISITALTVVKYVGVALCIEIAFLIIWTAVDPPKAHLVGVNVDKLQWRCESKTRIFWIIFLALKGVWLLLGAGIVVITRKVLRQYKEFTAIVYAVYNNLILMAIAIPLALLLWEVPNGTLVITVIVIVLAFTFTLFILFFDSWTQVLFPQFSDLSLESIPSTTSASDMGSAHETAAHDTQVEAE